MGKGYLPLFLDTFEETVDLTDEEFGRLIRAIGAYAKGEEDYASIITGNERYAFRFLKGQVDRNMEISTARSKAGSIKKEHTDTYEIKSEQNESNVIMREQSVTYSTKEKENNKENNNKKEKELLFARFWSAYPRHEAKAVAQRAFEKLNPDESLLMTMIAAIAKWKDSAQWQEAGGQYIPHPATWINQRRWEDEPPKASGKTVAAQNYDQRNYSGEETMDDVLNRLKGRSA